MGSAWTFGAWLRQRRQERGLTQDQLSEYLDVSLALLRKLESGERRPSGQIAYLLAGYFRVPADEHAAFVAFARTGRALPMPAGGAAGSLAPAAPWRSVYRRQTNLPAVLTPLIGREHEVATALDHLRHPKTRLLTLAGAPGIGKTRLSLQVALDLVDYFEDGVFFVDLAPVGDPSLVLPAVARTLGLQEAAGGPIERRLQEHVSARRMLLLLDNFEHVLDAAPAVVALLEASPWLKILVTSREALHVRGERRLAVPPLALPDPRQLPSITELPGYAAVALFVERARLVAPEFALTAENAADIAALCLGLEGLPLAIELAAARAGHFAPREMRRALGSRLKLLTGGSRDLPPRQRTLRSAIAWSYDLLAGDEPRLFRQLGVFVGGCTAEAGAAICAPHPDRAGAVLASLLSLADKHLVQAQPRNAAGERRFRLFETVREYALEQMARQGETAEIRSRHAEYYLGLAEQAEAHFARPRGPAWGAAGAQWIDRLDADLDNIRAALDWFQQQADAEMAAAGDPAGARPLDHVQQGLRLATGLRRVWLARGHFIEGRQRLLGFLAQVPKPVPAAPPQLRPAYAEGLLVVGRLTLLQGDVGSVRPLLEESLSIVTQSGDRQRVAFTLLNLGAVAAAQRDYAAARRYQEACLRLYRELGNAWGAGAALQDLGDLALDAGNLGAARPLLEESLALYRTVGETFGAASALASLGRVAYAGGDYATARAFWEESLQRRREIGDRSRAGHSLMLLGWVALREGHYDEARARFADGLLLARELGAVFTLYACLVGLGALAGAQQTPQRAALLFAAAAGLRQARSLPPAAADQAELESEIAAARAQLPAAVWNQAWQAGSALPIEQVIAAALG